MLRAYNFTPTPVDRKNDESYVNTAQRLDISSASHTADVGTIIQIDPNFVQKVPSDGSNRQLGFAASTLTKMPAKMDIRLGGLI